MLTTVLGGRAFAEKYGADPVSVVALHGWGRTRADWAGILDGHDALAVDQPGFGATPEPGSGWSTAEYAAWAAELLEPLDRPVLAGHSFGGRVAVRLASAHPELVRGVLLTGVPLLRPPSTGGRSPLAYRLARSLHRRGLLGDARMEAYRQKFGSEDYRNATGVMREVLVKAVNEDYTIDLETMQRSGLPVAMVWGEHDTAAPVTMARTAAGILGEHATLHVVPGSAHLLDGPLREAIRGELDRLVAA